MSRRIKISKDCLALIKKIGANIRRRREELGVDGERFAKRLKISPSWLSQIERPDGSKVISIPLLYKVAKELDVSITKLFN